MTEDVNELVRRWQDERCVDCRNALAERYLPFVRTVCRNMKRPPSMPLEDYESWAVTGLLGTIDKFDTSRGLDFKTLLTFKVRGAVLDAVRAESWIPRKVLQDGEQIKKMTSMNAVDPSDPDAERQFTDVKSPAPDAELLRSEFRKSILSSLNSVDRQIVQLYFFEHKIMKEIAAILGLSESRVSQRMADILTRLRERLEPPKSYGSWKRSEVTDRPLTDDEKALVESYLADYPNPIAFLKAKYYGIYAKCRHLGMTDDEINSAGMEGIVRAAKTYDPSRLNDKGQPIKFITFAGWWIAQRCSRTAEGPANSRPRDGRRLVSGNARFGHTDDGDSFFHSLADAAADQPAESASEHDRIGRLRKDLANAFRFIDPRYRAIIEARFGLNDGIERTLEETAKRFNLNRERVRQIEEKVFDKLYDRFDAAPHLEAM